MRLLRAWTSRVMVEGSTPAVAAMASTKDVLIPSNSAADMPKLIVIVMGAS